MYTVMGMRKACISYNLLSQSMDYHAFHLPFDRRLVRDAPSSLAGASGSEDVDTDWDREFFGAGPGRTGEPSPNDARDVTRANYAKGLKELLNEGNKTGV